MCFFFSTSCCYAFSALDAISAAYAVSYGQMQTLSVQEIVDCSRSSGNLGCAGGSMQNGNKNILK